jgi:hypothetical protein
MHEFGHHPLNTATRICTAVGMLTLGATGLYVGEAITGGHLFAVQVNVPEVTAKTPPPTIEAEAQPQTITLSETDITYTCNGVVSEGIYTSGKDGRNWVDSATINKEWFPSADVCGNNNVLNADALIKGFTSHGHKVITQVSAVVPPIVPEMTGIDMTNVMNCCIDVNKGEDDGQIRQAVNKFELAKYHNKEPNDASGFKFTAWLGHNNTPDVIIYSQMEAQIAFELDTATNKIIAKQIPNIDRAFLYELKGMYPGAKVTLTQREQSLSEVAQIEARETEFLPEVAQSIDTMKFEEITKGKNKELQLDMTGPNNSQMDVGYPEPDTMTPFQVNKLNKFTGRLLQKFEWKPPVTSKAKR